MDPKAVHVLTQEALKRCTEDVLFYARWVRTRDEADPLASIKAFPVEKAYVKQILGDMTREQRLAIVKSRQMLVSWIVCVFMTHWARSRDHQHVLYQTQQEEDAFKMVALPGVSGESGGFMGRCQFIEHHLPTWLRQPIKESEGRVMYPNGSMIEGLPKGANKIRSKTPSLVVLDEMAFLEEAKGTWTATAPLVQKGAHVIMISTPNGAEGSMFWHLWTGVPMT